MSRGTRELASLETDIDRLRISLPLDVSDARAELLGLDKLRERIALLAAWAVRLPKATSQLLRVIAADPRLSLELAATVLGCEVLDDDDIDEVVAAAFPQLSGPLFDAAADRVGVREIVGIAEGVGYKSVRAPETRWLWPKGKPFPPFDTVAGVQARLNYLDLGAGPVTGEWTEQTRLAFTRWQVLNGFVPSGELDDDAEYLAFKTPDAPD
jgi:hypothetical protein